MKNESKGREKTHSPATCQLTGNRLFAGVSICVHLRPSAVELNGSGLGRTNPVAAFTLIELMVVVAIIGILSAMIIPEMKGSYQDALLRSTSRDLIDVFDLTYSRAVSLNQVRRVLLDEKEGRYLVEKQVDVDGEEHFVPADEPGCKGRLDSKITIVFRAPDEVPVEDEQPAIPKAGRETPEAGTGISFYPDGTADPGVIELTDKEGFRLALKINPVTARVHVEELDRQ